jgi:hypothetical protein
LESAEQCVKNRHCSARVRGVMRQDDAQRF